MTIVNMVGGGGDELIVETIQGAYYIQGTAGSKSSTSGSKCITYVNPTGNVHVAYNDEHLLMGFEYIQSTGVSSLLNFIVYSSYNTITEDTLGDFIKSKCPEGKTISGTIYGMSGMLEQNGQYTGACENAALTVSGDRSTITYTGLPSGKNYTTYNIYTRGARIFPITVSIDFI